MSNQFKNFKGKSNLIEELEEKRKIIELQKKFESGSLREEELTLEEKEKLIILYKEQIKTLETNISNYKKELRYYRDKIIAIRNKPKM